jgi:hypothetical protein
MASPRPTLAGRHERGRCYNAIVRPPSTSDQGTSTTTLCPHPSPRQRRHQPTTARKCTWTREKGEQDGEEKGKELETHRIPVRTQYLHSTLLHPLSPLVDTADDDNGMDNGNYEPNAIVVAINQ